MNNRFLLTNVNILIIYYGSIYPITSTIRDYLYSFREYSPHRCFYVNVAFARIPDYLLKIDFNLVIIDKTFLGTRWSMDGSRNKLELMMERISRIKQITAPIAIFPQDEFYNPYMLCRFIKEFNVDYVFSVAPESEWPLIYQGVNFSKVRFYKVLTGYLSDTTIQRTKIHGKKLRTVDIGYRAGHYNPPWFGRHGMLKIKIADVFLERAQNDDLVMDISKDKKKILWGDSWYEFLYKCKYTIGVEGGTSLLDRDGSIRIKTEEYVRSNSEACFEEVEAACFAGQDCLLHLFALSPRHLEACATETCQILVEGNYDGVLVPNKHYLPLKPDFSNIEEVLKMVKEDNRREKIVLEAYKDIVESGRYSYRQFVQYVLEQCIGLPENNKYESRQKWITWAYCFSLIQERFYWNLARLKGQFVSAYERLHSNFS